MQSLIVSLVISAIKQMGVVIEIEQPSELNIGSTYATWTYTGHRRVPVPPYFSL